MSFWKGFAQAVKEEDEQRQRAQELAEERAIRAGEIADERSFQKEMFFLKLGEERRNTLLELAINKKAEEEDISKYVESMMWVANKVGGAEGGEQFIEDLKLSPKLFDDVKNLITETEKKTGRPITGEQLMEHIKVIGVKIDDPGFKEKYKESGDLFGAILGGDFSDPNAYAEMHEDITTSDGPLGAATISVDPELYRETDVELYKAQEETLWNSVYASAENDIFQLSQDPNQDQVASTLFSTVEKAKKGDAAAKTSLFREYGRETIESGLAGDPKFWSGWEMNPMFQPYFPKQERSETDTPNPSPALTPNPEVAVPPVSQGATTPPPQPTVPDPIVAAPLPTFDWEGAMKQAQETGQLVITEEMKTAGPDKIINGKRIGDYATGTIVRKGSTETAKPKSGLGYTEEWY